MRHIQTKSDSELILQLAIARITFLKFHEKVILSKKLDSLRSLVLLSMEEISSTVNRTINSRSVWNGKETLHMAEMALHYCKALNIHIILNTDKEYPDLLKNINDPPYLLFCRGNPEILESARTVSVVGTRRLTPNGRECARSFAYDAALNGCTVISGLANGADGYAHEGVLNAYYDTLEKGGDASKLGKTVAVLPSAIDEIVPYGHRRLAAKIIETGGCLISEYEPKMPMANWHFVGRNRIIAGLSPATVVIEAPAGSGALITADFALEYNRDVMFHRAAFESSAVKIAKESKKKLDVDFAAGKVSKYKVENTLEKYIEAGAPVIKDYNDYCECLSEVPGKRTQGYAGRIILTM